MLETLGEVYHYDDQAQGLSAEERLLFHQEHSWPVMEKLHGWLDAQLQEKKVEPNSPENPGVTRLALPRSPADDSGAIDPLVFRN